MVPCCQDLASLTDAPCPFSRVIALGFYDGPISGVLECGSCHAIFRFEMLDLDEEQAVRVFRLARLPEGSLEACVAALADAEPPHWPVWVPFADPVHQHSEEARQKADRAVREILDKARPAELAVAWIGYCDRVLAAREMPLKELNEQAEWFSLDDPNHIANWFERLGLARKKRTA